MTTLEKLHHRAAQQLTLLIRTPPPLDASPIENALAQEAVDGIADYTIAKATQTVLYAAEEANRAQPTPKP